MNATATDVPLPLADLDALPTDQLVTMRREAYRILERRNDEALPGVVLAAVTQATTRAGGDPTALGAPVSVAFTTREDDNRFIWHEDAADVTFEGGAVQQLDLSVHEELSGRLGAHEEWKEPNEDATLTVTFNPPTLSVS